MHIPVVVMVCPTQVHCLSKSIAALATCLSLLEQMLVAETLESAQRSALVDNITAHAKFVHEHVRFFPRENPAG